MPAGGRETPTVEDLPDLQELDEAQAQLDTEIAQQEAERQREEAEEARKKARAVPLATRHGESVAEARELHQKIRAKDAKGVGKRIEEAEALETEEGGLAGELEGAVAKFKQAEACLEEVEKRIEGRDPDKVAARVKEVREAVAIRVEALQGPVAELESRLQSVRERKLSPEEIADYQGLQAEMDTVLARIQEIGEIREKEPSVWEASEPEALEALKSEAETEKAMRVRLFEVIAREDGLMRGEGARHQIMKRALERFITEEIDKAGINAIGDPTAREGALHDLEEGLIKGLQASRPDDESQNIQTDEKRKAFYSGAALRVLALHPGFISSLDDYLARSETGRAHPSRFGVQPKQSAEEVQRQEGEHVEGFNNALSHHIDTLNLFRAYAAEIGQDKRRGDAPTPLRVWNAAASAGLWSDPRVHYVARPDGPILPKPEIVGDVALTAAEDRYAADRTNARTLEGALLDKDLTELTPVLEATKKVLEGLQAKANELERLAGIINPPDRNKVMNELTASTIRIRDLEGQKIREEQDLTYLKKKNWIKKLRGNSFIKGLITLINEERKNMAPNEQRKKEMDQAVRESNFIHKENPRLSADISYYEGLCAGFQQQIDDVRKRQVENAGQKQASQ